MAQWRSAIRNCADSIGASRYAEPRREDEDTFERKREFAIRESIRVQPAVNALYSAEHRRIGCDARRSETVPPETPGTDILDTPT